MFNALFRKGNENITKALIQDITEREYKIIDMDKNVIMYDGNVDGKNEVLDLKVELDDGEICNLEIQLANKKNDINSNCKFQYKRIYKRRISYQMAN